MNLRDLDLSVIIKLEMLPTWFGDLKDLETLILSATSIVELPSAIGRLGYSRRLNLERTKLATLPTELGALKKLEALNLRKTRVAALPGSIAERVYSGHLKLGWLDMGNGSNGVVSCAAVAEINSIPSTSLRLLQSLHTKQDISDDDASQVCLS